MENTGSAARGHALAVLAMARWRLGEREAAREALAKGEELAPPIMPGRVVEDPGDAWRAWLFARVSLDEAAGMMQSDPAANREPGAP